MNCDGDGVPDSALRSCHNFITTARNKTGALLSRLQPIRLRKREILLNKVFLGPENVD
jgi:hypothetical protein